MTDGQPSGCTQRRAVCWGGAKWADARGKKPPRLTLHHHCPSSMLRARRPSAHKLVGRWTTHSTAVGGYVRQSSFGRRRHGTSLSCGENTSVGEGLAPGSLGEALHDLALHASMCYSSSPLYQCVQVGGIRREQLTSLAGSSRSTPPTGLA